MIPKPAPPSWSPRLVLAHALCARACLLGGLLLLAVRPDAPAGSFLHPLTLATAHLLVLGFVVVSVIGAFHLVAPLALAARRRTGKGDWAVLVTVLLVASGVVAHLALGTYGGVAWSAGLLVVALVLALPGWLLPLATSPAPLPTVLGTASAWLALLLTVCLGGALAVHRASPFLPADPLTALAGHAHLGIFGFAGTMLVALGLRLLPMFLPAEPPRGPLSWLAVLGTAAGGLGMGGAPFWPGLVGPCAGLLAVGLLAFLLAVVGMLRRRKPAPPDLPRPDPARAMILLGLLSLLAAAPLGLGFAFGTARPDQAVAYGALLVLGFLGAPILGFGWRLLPLLGWFAAWRDLPDEPIAPPTPPRQVGLLPLQWLTVLAWGVGLLLLALGCADSSAAMARLGALLLLLAAAADAGNLVVAWRRRLPPAIGPAAPPRG